ncbi:MAG: aldehyde dehydrogenase family protein [Anaerolineae bacterium]|nr:aldehyde dehydrogenase family protein [Anaerolineae bacterium]
MLEKVHPGVEAFLKQSPIKMIIGGQQVASVSGKTFPAINSSDGSTLAQIYSGEVEDVNRAVEAARKAADGKWATMAPAERERILRRFAALIEEHGEELAQLESLDNGKPIHHTRFIDAKASAGNMHHWAGAPSRVQGETTPVSIPDLFVYTRREPVGVIAIIIPWNYPLIHFTQKAGPALACGNAVILKPASVTSLAALRLGELGLEAGLPEGALNIITGPGRLVGEALSSHPHIDKVQITGSTEVGKQIIRNSAVNIKRITLELGSKAPNCIFEDADLEKAVPGAFNAAFGHTGQSCVAGCRLFVQRPVYDAVLNGLLDMAAKVRIGNAMDLETVMGPVVDPAQFNTITSYIKDGIDSGATLKFGGERLSPPAVPEGGYYLPPTIFTNVADDAKISKEEIFGPVVNVYAFDTEEELVQRANATTYGLAAGLWTTNAARVHRVAHQIKAGVVWVNTYDMFSANVPFGGFKQSGYGRDNSKTVIDAVTEVKAVWVSTKP